MKHFICVWTITSFIATSIMLPRQGYAQEQLNLTVPGTMVYLSPEFTPAHLKGIIIHPENPLKFDFLITRGDEILNDRQKHETYQKLIKYFLASLAIPDEDQWVNLSPYEKDRIIKDDFGKTEMGRDLLAQDYMLKQITASLIYPEGNLGKRFWDTVYAQSQEQFGTSDIPVNTFNKVWIIPDSAYVYEHGNMVYVVSQHLKVMLEEDYLSLSKHTGITNPSKINKLGNQIVREIVLPALEKEVNEGKNFALLRQIYSGMILAAWYKYTLKESFLGKIYANKNKLKGIDQDPKNNAVIYKQYLQAFKKGVFNYIKEDVDKYSRETIPRKYFSGGMRTWDSALLSKDVKPASMEMVTSDLAMRPMDLVPTLAEELKTAGMMNRQIAGAAMIVVKSKRSGRIIGLNGTKDEIVAAAISRLPLNPLRRTEALAVRKKAREVIGTGVEGLEEPHQLYKYLSKQINKGYLSLMKREGKTPSDVIWDIFPKVLGYWKEKYKFDIRYPAIKRRQLTIFLNKNVEIIPRIDKKAKGPLEIVKLLESGKSLDTVNSELGSPLVRMTVSPVDHKIFSNAQYQSLPAIDQYGYSIGKTSILPSDDVYHVTNEWSLEYILVISNNSIAGLLKNNKSLLDTKVDLIPRGITIINIDHHLLYSPEYHALAIIDENRKVIENTAVIPTDSVYVVTSRSGFKYILVIYNDPPEERRVQIEIRRFLDAVRGIAQKEVNVKKRKSTLSTDITITNLPPSHATFTTKEAFTIRINYLPKEEKSEIIAVDDLGGEYLKRLVALADGNLRPEGNTITEDALDGPNGLLMTLKDKGSVATRLTDTMVKKNIYPRLDVVGTKSPLDLVQKAITGLTYYEEHDGVYPDDTYELPVELIKELLRSNHIPIEELPILLHSVERIEAEQKISLAEQNDQSKQGALKETPPAKNSVNPPEHWDYLISALQEAQTLLTIESKPIPESDQGLLEKAQSNGFYISEEQKPEPEKKILTIYYHPTVSINFETLFSQIRNRSDFNSGKFSSLRLEFRSAAMITNLNQIRLTKLEQETLSGKQTLLGGVLWDSERVVKAARYLRIKMADHNLVFSEPFVEKPGSIMIIPLIHRGFLLLDRSTQADPLLVAVIKEMAQDLKLEAVNDLSYWAAEEKHPKEAPYAHNIGIRYRLIGKFNTSRNLIRLKPTLRDWLIELENETFNTHLKKKKMGLLFKWRSKLNLGVRENGDILINGKGIKNQPGVVVHTNDLASLTQLKGGIDFNAANLDLKIKRDGKGVPLPFSQQNVSRLNNLEGLEPVILEIRPATNLPV